MAKKYRRRKSGKGMERLFIGMIVALVVLIVVGVAISLFSGEGGYTVSADGHIHDGQGNHVADYADLFGDGEYTISADGHVHDANGNHVADMSELLNGSVTLNPAAE